MKLQPITYRGQAAAATPPSAFFLATNYASATVLDELIARPSTRL